MKFKKQKKYTGKFYGPVYSENMENSFYLEIAKTIKNGGKTENIIQAYNTMNNPTLK